jgi:hypothetical protein
VRRSRVLITSLVLHQQKITRERRSPHTFSRALHEQFKVPRSALVDTGLKILYQTIGPIHLGAGS